MSVVKYITYTNRLAKMVSLPGGKRMSEALADADANLKEIEAPCLVAMDEAIARIRKLGPKSATSREHIDEVYGAANEIIGLAGVFGMADLGQAAYSLCELIDLGAANGCDPKAVKVHIDSLRLLRIGEALAESERKAVLDGLAEVVGAARSAA